jgi:hypothetical protein
MSGLKKDQKPFRIWDENAKRDLPWRCYKTFERAIEKSLILLVWLDVGNSYTVYDSRSHKARAQWKRTVNGLREFRE